jgi:hypothetical protein
VESVVEPVEGAVELRADTLQLARRLVVPESSPDSEEEKTAAVDPTVAAVIPPPAEDNLWGPEGPVSVSGPEVYAKLQQQQRLAEQQLDRVLGMVNQGCTSEEFLPELKRLRGHRETLLRYLQQLEPFCSPENLQQLESHYGIGRLRDELQRSN